MKALLLISLLLVASCKCQQSGVLRPIQPCVTGTTTCLAGRPYACGDGAWRPVGDTACASIGGVCCLDAVSQVHACVASDRCAPSSSGGM